MWSCRHRWARGHPVSCRRRRVGLPPGPFACLGAWSHLWRRVSPWQPQGALCPGIVRAVRELRAFGMLIPSFETDGGRSSERRSNTHGNEVSAGRSERIPSRSARDASPDRAGEEPEDPEHVAQRTTEPRPHRRQPRGHARLPPRHRRLRRRGESACGRRSSSFSRSPVALPSRSHRYRRAHVVPEPEGKAVEACFGRSVDEIGDLTAVSGD